MSILMYNTGKVYIKAINNKAEGLGREINPVEISLRALFQGRLINLRTSVLITNASSNGPVDRPLRRP